MSSARDRRAKVRTAGDAAIRRRQRGAAFLLALLLLALAALALAATDGLLAAAARAADRSTAAALARARDALIGRAVADDNRPGSLPCPALDEGGQVALFVGNRCPTYIGRFPWKAMKTGELRDGRGDLLWYALAPALRDHPAVEPLDGQTAATLSVDGLDGVAALLFSPGPPLPGQTRHAASTIADHLDGANADGDDAYATTGTNDRLLPITRNALFRPVGLRVLAEIRGPGDSPVAGLRGHHTTYGIFPWADGNGDGHTDDGVAHGRVPYRELTLPDWLERNGWFARVAYRRDGVDGARLELGDLRLDVRPCPASPCP